MEPPANRARLETSPTLKLSIDLLHTIFRTLRSFADHAHASAVCRDWFVAAVTNPRPTPMLALPSFTTPFVGQYTRISSVCFVWHPAASQEPQPPAVLLPMLASSAPPPLPIRAWTASLHPPPTPSPPFLRPFGQGSCYVEGFPEDAGGARLCGSFPGGWVAFSLNNWRGHCLVNVNTRHRINLPDLVRSPAPQHDCIVSIKSMVLSAAPTSDGAYMVAAITSGLSNISFWRPGADRWRPPTPSVANGADFPWRLMLPRDHVIDLIFFRGRLHQGFYVLDSQERLTVYVEDEDGGHGNSNNGSLNPIMMRKITYSIITDIDDYDRLIRGHYLVESCGELIMVRHLDYPEEFELFTLKEEYDLGGDQVRATWVKCPTLAGRALFLGRGCSRSAESGNELGHIVHCSFSSESTEWFYL